MNEETTTPRFYSTRKVAEMFDVSVYTVREWIKDWQASDGARGLEGFQINGRWKISHEAVMKFGKARHGRG